MSASQAPAIHAVALQLAAALDQYEADVATMVETWPDLERYGVVSAQVEEVRRLASTVPPLAADWVELLIAHAELVHCLWRLKFGSPGSPTRGLGELRSHHAWCITALRASCVRLAQRSGR